MRIEVRPETLRSASRALGDAAAVAREVHRGSSSLVAATGHEGLTEALSDFRRSWSYGLGLIVDDAQTLQRMLGQAAETYAALERTIGDACRP
jgi:hypothetical protein